MISPYDADFGSSLEFPSAMHAFRTKPRRFVLFIGLPRKPS
jgi:hypothetical protein